MVALNNEHRHIASLLDGLAEQADRLLPGRTPDFELMLDIAQYMSAYPDEYHHPREDLLFAQLTARDPDAGELVGQLLEGHKEIFRRSRELLGELKRVVRDGEAADNRRLKYLCDRYIGFYWEHINLEEGKVFPRATAKLRQDDWYAVNSQARYVGHRGHCRRRTLWHRGADRGGGHGRRRCWRDQGRHCQAGAGIGAGFARFRSQAGQARWRAPGGGFDRGLVARARRWCCPGDW
jgi:hemerythrin-like domain-containing protein